MESLSRQLQGSSTGQRAGLRRMPLTKSLKADATVIAFITKANVSRYELEHDFDRWRMVTHFAAMLVGTGESGPTLPFVHVRNKSLGGVLEVVMDLEAGLIHPLSDEYLLQAVSV